MGLFSKGFKRIEKVEAAEQSATELSKVITPQLPSKEAMQTIANQVIETVKEQPGNLMMDKVNHMIQIKKDEIKKDIVELEKQIAIKKEALKVIESIGSA